MAGLGRAMNNSVGSLFRQQLVNQDSITDIALNEAIAWIACNRNEILRIPGVSEFVKIHNMRALFGDNQPNEGRPDKARSAGNEKFHIAK